MGLDVKENKIKCKVVGDGQHAPYLQIAGHKFQKVQGFIYLGTNNSYSKEIEKRIVATSKKYYELNNHFGAILIMRETKVELYKTLVRLVLLYSSAFWVVNKTSREKKRQPEDPMVGRGREGCS